MFFSVSILSPQKVIFEGKAQSLILPGECGVFEVLEHHKPLLSRLMSGTLLVNEKVIPIKRGIAKIDRNRALVIVEET